MGRNKSIRAGYQGKADAMRDKADKLMRGGKCEKPQKFAMGGVAKIRHGEATEQGLPKSGKRKSIKSLM